MLPLRVLAPLLVDEVGIPLQGLLAAVHGLLITYG